MTSASDETSAPTEMNLAAGDARTRLGDPRELATVAGIANRALRTSEDEVGVGVANEATSAEATSAGTTLAGKTSAKMTLAGTTLAGTTSAGTTSAGAISAGTTSAKTTLAETTLVVAISAEMTLAGTTSAKTTPAEMTLAERTLAEMTPAEMTLAVAHARAERPSVSFTGPSSASAPRCATMARIQTSRTWASRASRTSTHPARTTPSRW